MFRPVFLTLLSSLLSVLSFPLPDFSWFAWVSFIPLFFALENKSKKQAFWLSYLWGVIFWAGLIFWLVNVTFLGYVFLILYLAVYFGVFGLITSYGLRITNYGFLFISSAWVSLEYLRSHLFTGFGWALLGYSQYRNLALIQIADITGAYGVSFLIVLVNVAIFKFINTCFKRKSLVPGAWCLVPFFCVVLCFIYGRLRIPHLPSPRKALRISLVQGNISPYEKWDAAFRNEILEKYITLSRVSGSKNPQMIIWPETAFPGFWEEERDLREKVLGLAGELKTNLLIGAPALEENLRYNCSILVSPQRGEIKRYRKIHLVPFGEYIPFAKIFQFLRKKFDIGEYERGEEFSVFTIQCLPCTPHTDNRFSVLVCFEDIFPALVRKFVQNGAEFLVNIAEDGWYGKSGASFQHTQAAVFRAVENRRFVVRVANTGYSCVIDTKGKIVSELKDAQGNRLFITGVHTGEVLPNPEMTFYSHRGDWFVFACILITFLVSSLVNRKQKYPCNTSKLYKIFIRN